MVAGALLMPTLAIAQSVKTDYPSTGALLGIGWQSGIGEPADATCVMFAADSFTADNAQNVKVDVRAVRTTEHFYSLTETSTSVILKKTLGNGGTFKTKFIDSVTVDSDKQTYLVSARIDNATEFTAPPQDGELRLSDNYLKLLKTQGLAKFQKVCGDSFVFRRYGGAELIGLSEVTTFTRDEQDKASVNWSGSVLSVKLDGDINTEENRKRFSEELKFGYFLGGGNSAANAASRRTECPGVHATRHGSPWGSPTGLYL